MQLEDGSMAYIHRTPKGGATGIMTAGRKGDELAAGGRGVAYPGSWAIVMERGPELPWISNLNCLLLCAPQEQLFLSPGGGALGVNSMSLDGSCGSSTTQILGL